MEAMTWFRRFGKPSRKSHSTEDRARRIERIAELGFTIVERHGWHEGIFAARRYELFFGGQSMGIYSSSKEVMHAAEAFKASSMPNLDIDGSPAV